MKPKAVLAYCREKGIRSVDLRFVDIDGTWRRITLPLSALNETSFEEGFGHSLLLDCSANQQPVHLILDGRSIERYPLEKHAWHIPVITSEFNSLGSVRRIAILNDNASKLVVPSGNKSVVDKWDFEARI